MRSVFMTLRYYSRSFLHVILSMLFVACGYQVHASDVGGYCLSVSDVRGEDKIKAGSGMIQGGLAAFNDGDFESANSCYQDALHTLSTSRLLALVKITQAVELAVLSASKSGDFELVERLYEVGLSQLIGDEVTVPSEFIGLSKGLAKSFFDAKDPRAHLAYKLLVATTECDQYQPWVSSRWAERAEHTKRWANRSALEATEVSGCPGAREFINLINISE